MERRLERAEKIHLVAFQPDEEDGVGQVIARADDGRIGIRLAIGATSGQVLTRLFLPSSKRALQHSKDMK